MYMLKTHSRLNMEDHLQVRNAQENNTTISSHQPSDSGLSVLYDTSEESCSIVGIPNKDHQESLSGVESDVDSIMRSDNQEYRNILLRDHESKSRFQLVCPNCYSFFTSYRSSDPEVKITPFAIVLLIVLFLVYVLNQADRLVLPVTIPAGLRCEASVKSECANDSNDTMFASFAGGGRDVTEGSGAWMMMGGSGVGGGEVLFDVGSSNESNLTNSTTEDCIHFDDDQQGLLTGPAFIVIYVVAGLPLARLADTRSRSLVLLLGVVFWSGQVLLTGFVTAFWQLLLLRILLGIGEATCNPVAYSLLADHFPSKHRAFALSVYHYGVYVGGALSWWSASINLVLSWRWTFRILGIAGLLMTPLAAMALWEPKRVRQQRKERMRGKNVYTIKEVALFLAKNPPFWMLLLAGSIRNIPGYALGAWLPTFFARQYNVEADDYSIPVGFVVLLGGGLGSFLGGFLSDRLSSRWKNAKAYVIAVSQFLAAPCIIGVLIAPTSHVSYGLLVLAYISAETWLGPAAAIVQDICMPAMRAQASAIYIGVITIVASVGPVIVPGLLNLPSFDSCTTGVGHALLITVPTFYILSAILFLLLGVVILSWDKWLATHPTTYAVFENSTGVKNDDEDTTEEEITDTKQ